MKNILFVDYEEIGALFYYYARAINNYSNNKLKAYYASFGGVERTHDSNAYHFGSEKKDWVIGLPFSAGANGYEITDAEEKVDCLKTIAEEKKPDLILTNGRGGMLCHMAGLKYCYWTYGGDIEQAAFGIKAHTDMPQKHRFMVDYVYSKLDLEPGHKFSKSLRDNIFWRSLAMADSYLTSPRALPYLLKINKNPRIFRVAHLLEEMPSKNQIETLLQKREKSPRKIFFSSTRHCWGAGREYITDGKANDLFIRAVAKYREKSGDREFELRMIEKGPDVELSKKLIDDLDLSSQTVWIREMKRSELSAHYSEATFCFGQFAFPNVEYSGMEPMAFGVPTFSWYGLVDEFPLSRFSFYSPPPPVVNLKDPARIADKMVELLTDHDSYKKLGMESWSWIRQNCSVGRLVDDLAFIAEGNDPPVLSTSQDISIAGDGDAREVEKFFSASYDFLLDLEKVTYEHDLLRAQHKELGKQHKELGKQCDDIANSDSYLIGRKITGFLKKFGFLKSAMLYFYDDKKRNMDDKGSL